MIVISIIEVAVEIIEAAVIPILVIEPTVELVVALAVKKTVEETIRSC